MSNKVIFVLGSGGRVGAALARKFASNGYKVALASRSATPGTTAEGYLNVKLDLENPEDVQGAFETVKKAFGHPSVVVYNAAKVATNPELVAVPISDLTSTLNVNITSAYAAAQSAVLGRPSESSKLTYIYTGNAFSASLRWPDFFTAGIGKSGAAHMVECLGIKYTEKNALFYNTDERFENGDPVGGKISAEAHAEFYYELARREKDNQGPILETFVAGKGYQKFE